MKRHRISRMQADPDGGMDISSLVDICFLLLIYFLVTSVIMPAERDLPMGSPGQSEDDKTILIEPLLIAINSSGQIFAGDDFERMPLDANPDVRDLPLLLSRLEIHKQAAKASGGDCLVVIDADDGVRTQRVVDVLNALAGMEIRKVTFRDRVEGR